jgi:hypothetical protein
MADFIFRHQKSPQNGTNGGDFPTLGAKLPNNAVHQVRPAHHDAAPAVA